MISKLDILIKSITLLYRERVLNKDVNSEQQDNSKDIVKQILKTFRNDKKQLQGGDTSVIIDLQNLLMDMLNNPDNFDKDNLLQTLQVLLKDKESVYSILEKAINTEMEPSGLKNSIISLRKYLLTYHKQVEITNIIAKAHYELSTGRLDKPIQEYAADLTSMIEGLNTTVKAKDPGVMNELDFKDVDSISDVMVQVKDNAENGIKLVTGWKDINRMLNGGFRRGEQWVITALQHNYKSGFVDSVFAQLCSLNKPVMTDPTKKPLNVLISFEDDASITLEFLYRYFYYNEFKQIPDLTKISSSDMAKYITSKLTQTGYNAKILRVNPSEWTYKNIVNKILEYEAQGYEIHVLVVDYLSKLPTTYCERSGPSGTDVRDLFNRIRNICSA